MSPLISMIFFSYGCVFIESLTVANSYSCNHEDAEILTYDAIDVGTCDEVLEEEKETEYSVQVMQKINVKPHKYKRCKLELFQIAYQCGMHSHISGLKILQMGSQSLEESRCREIFKYKTFQATPTSQPIDVDIGVNHFNVSMLGFSTADGYCGGRGEWKYGNVILQNYIVENNYILTLDEFDSFSIGGVHKLLLDKVSTENTDFDSELGRWYMNKEEEKCEDDYQEIYSGLASSNKVIKKDSLVVIRDDSTKQFSASKLTTQRVVCGRVVWESTSQDVYYLFTDDQRQLQLNRISGLNVRSGSCSNKLHLKGEGYIARRRGRILQIGKCVNVSSEVTLRKTNTCYEHLPVWYRGKPLFRHHSNHVLLPNALTTDCEKDWSIFKINGRYAGQRPYIDFKIASPLLMLPEKVGVSKTLNNFKGYEDVGTLWAGSLDDMVDEILIATRRYSLRKKWIGGLESLGYYDEQQDGEEDPGWGIIEFLNGISSEIYKNGGIIGIVLGALFAGFILYAVGAWAFIFLVGACMKGFFTQECFYMFISIFVGAWYLISFVPCWIKNFPDYWRNLPPTGTQPLPPPVVEKKQINNINNFIQYNPNSVDDDDQYYQNFVDNI